MEVAVYRDSSAANHAAADYLAQRLSEPQTRNVILAGGNTPLKLYRLIAHRASPLRHLNVFALDEYVGVPLEDPRTCANLLRRTVAEAWGIPSNQFHALSSLPQDTLASIHEHERRITKLSGIDVIVLGLGPNGHLGFNEPGSAVDSVGRVVDLEPESVAANRAWFSGEYAPARGVTVGLKTILSAEGVFILAYGQNKAGAVANMIEGPQTLACPASWLQGHPSVSVFLDKPAASELDGEALAHMSRRGGVSD